MTNVVHLETDNRYFFVTAHRGSETITDMWSMQFPTLAEAQAAVEAHYASYARGPLVRERIAHNEKQSWQAYGPEGEAGPSYTICPITQADTRSMEADEKRQHELIASVEKDDGAEGLHTLWIRRLCRLAEIGGDYSVDELVEDVRRHGRRRTDTEMLEFMQRRLTAEAEVRRRIYGSQSTEEAGR